MHSVVCVCCGGGGRNFFARHVGVVWDCMCVRVCDVCTRCIYGCVCMSRRVYVVHSEWYVGSVFG